MSNLTGLVGFVRLYCVACANTTALWNVRCTYVNTVQIRLYGDKVNSGNRRIYRIASRSEIQLNFIGSILQ